MAKKARRKGAKGRRGSVTSAKKGSAKKKRGGRLSAADKAARKAAIKKRVQLHQAASMLKDFHGGKLPIKSGCGRPRKK